MSLIAGSREVGAGSWELRFSECTGEGCNHLAQLRQFVDQLLSGFVGQETFSVEDDDHVGVFERGTASNVQEVREVFIGGAAGAFGDVVRRREAGAAQLFSKPIMVTRLQIVCNIE